MKKISLVALLVLVMAVLLGACAAPAPVAQPAPAQATTAPAPAAAEPTAAPAAAGAPIKIGADIGNVPWEFADKDNKFVGFEIDLVNEIGKRLGRPVEITNIPFNGLFGGGRVRAHRRGGFVDHDHADGGRSRCRLRSRTTTATSR